MVPTSTRVQVDVAAAEPAGADAVAVFVHKQKAIREYPGLGQVEREALSRLVSSGAVRGKSNEVTIQLLDGGKKARRLIVIGLGEEAKFSAQCLREAAGTLAKAARKQRIGSVAALPPRVPQALPALPGAAALSPGNMVALEALATGALLAGFDYEEYKGSVNHKSDEKEAREPLRVMLVAGDQDLNGARATVDRARILADAQNFSRTIASRPGNNINPPTLAKVAQELAREVGITCRVLDEKELKRLGMGGILGVGSGSINTPPRMIVLEYEGSGFRVRGSARRGSRAPIANRQSQIANAKPLLIIGKAITFDSGGISIKPADKMQHMIFDKSGGVAVLGIMYAIANLKLPLHVVGILSSAENILSESSYRPGDILRMYNGVTVEVTNTDAEGRLVLGDALAWGIETFKPAAVVDMATLTGGVVIALGKTMAGLMSNNDQLAAELTAAGQAVGEKIWRLPIWDEHREMMKSDPADIVNSGPARDASPLQGGAFLTYFVPSDGSVPWAHLDIAGVADTERESPLYARGSTGWGVRTIVQWLSRRATNK